MICHLELYEIGPSSDEWSELSGDTHVTITASQDSLLSRQLLMFTLLERKDSSMRMCTFVQICLLTTLFTIVQADTPANCSFKEVEGDWTFYIGDRGYDKTLNCSGFGYGKSNFFLLFSIIIMNCLLNGKVLDFNPLSDAKILDWSKLKQFADDISKWDVATSILFEFLRVCTPYMSGVSYLQAPPNFFLLRFGFS